MSDQAPEPTPPPAQPEKPAKTADDELVETLATRVLEAPMMSFVKDGTPTMRGEEKIHREWEDSERRRDGHEAEKQLARVPIERGGAKLFTNKLTQNPEMPKAYVLLHYVNRHGSKIPPGECCADIIMENASDPSDLTLVFICPKCIQSPKHCDTSQVKMRQSNKRWTLLPGKGAPTFTFDDGYGPQAYRSAGVVTESEPFTCGYCHWRAVIDNNRIRTL